MVLERLLKEGEALVRKHQKSISAVNKALKENANYGSELDDLRKVNLAQMLENVSSVFEARQALNEAHGVQTGDVARKLEYLTLITAVMPTLVAEEVASVQPLKQKAGVAYYMKHVYDSTKGAIKQGDTFSELTKVGPSTDDMNAEGISNTYQSAIEFSSERVSNEEVDMSSGTGILAWVPVRPGTVSCLVSGQVVKDDGEGNIGGGTIQYATGVITGITIDESDVPDRANPGSTKKAKLISYETDFTQAPVDVPAVKTIITDVTLTARARKLRTAFSLDAAFDLMATQNIDIQQLLQETATNEIRAEIDGEVLEDIRRSGTNLTVAFNQNVPIGLSKYEHYNSFYQTIIEGSNKIYQKTRRVSANFIIVGQNAANILETHPLFEKAGSINEAGPHVMGNLAKRFLVIKNPYYGEDDFVLGYKGSVPFDSGYIYAPYMPITSTQFIMGDNFQGTDRKSVV